MSEDFKIEFNKGKNLDFNFHGKLYIEDFANNPKLLQLFNFFDKDGNGIIESDSIQGNEFLNIFGYMKAAAEFREGKENKKLDAQEAALLGIFVKDLNGVSSGDIFEFLDIINSKKDIVINSKQYRSSDGTLTVVNSYQGGGEETVIYDAYGNIRFKVREQHLKESFIGSKGEQANGETKYKNQDGHSVSIKDGETEGSIVVSQDSIKYFKDKYNIDVAGAYYKNGIVEFIDKDGNPILHLTYDMAPDIKDELRNFIGSNLKESSEYLLNIPKSLGWLDKLGVSIQDYKFELNPAQWSLLGFHSAGLEKLNEYMEQARKNYEDGKALEESSSAQPGFFDSKLERMSGNKDIDYLCVERFRLTNMKYQEVKAINQRIEALKEGLKEAKRCYRNWETEKASSGRTHYEAEEKDFRAATMKALTEFFNGDQRIAGQFIQSLNSELKDKDDIEKNYLKILERVIKGAEEEKNKILDGESEDKLKSRYQKEYKSIYGREDITDEVEELTNNGKEAGGTIKLGMLTAIQIALGAFTGGTGNAALTAFLGYLETIGIDAALTTSNILSRAQDWDENATEELKQSVKGTAGFVGFGIVAANPFSKMIGKLTGKGYNALMKWFGVEEAGGLSKAFEKGAIKGAVRKGSGAVSETTITASQAFEWLAVKSSEMASEIGAFAGYEIATMDEDFITALDGNAKMLTKLKVMNSAIGVMLGSLIKNRAVKGQIKKAIKSYEETLKNAGLDNVKITENKTPTKTTYTIEINGQKIVCTSPEEMSSKVMAILAEQYIKSRPIPEEIKNLKEDELANQYVELIQKEKLTEEEQAKLIDIYNEMNSRGLLDENGDATEVDYDTLEIKKPEGQKSRPTDEILDDIRNAQTREDFIKLRDEIKVMPKSKEKSELIKAYQDKFKDWSKDPYRHEIKNQYEGEVKQVKLDKEELAYNLTRLRYGTMGEHNYGDVKALIENNLKTQDELEVLNFIFRYNQEFTTEEAFKIITKAFESPESCKKLLDTINEFEEKNKSRDFINKVIINISEGKSNEEIIRLDNLEDKLAEIMYQHKYEIPVWQVAQDFVQKYRNNPEIIEIIEKMLGLNYEKISFDYIEKAVKYPDVALKVTELFKKYEDIPMTYYTVESVMEKAQEDMPFVERRLKAINEVFKTQEHCNDITNMFNGDLFFVSDEEYANYAKWSHFGSMFSTIHLHNTPNIIEYFKIAYKNLNNPDKPQDVETIAKFEKLLNNTAALEALKNHEYILNDNGGIIPVDNYKVKEEDIINEDDIYDMDFVQLCRYQEQQKRLFGMEILNEVPLEYAVEAILKDHSDIANGWYDSFETSYMTEHYSKSNSALDILSSMSKEQIDTSYEKINKMIERTLKNPEMFLNGEHDKTSTKAIVDDFYNREYSNSLIKLVNIYDKETIDIMMRKRLDDFGTLLSTLNGIGEEGQRVIKEMINSCNIDGKPFMPTQKIEFLYLLKAYNDNHMPLDSIYKMLETGRIDLAKLNFDLFNKIMKNAGFTEEEISKIPPEKLISWNKEFSHYLSQAVLKAEDNAYADILRAANLEDFNKYIHDENNIYGQSNLKTIQIFKDNGLNYEKWINPSKENEIHFVSKDKNTERLHQIAKATISDIEALRQTPVKGFIDKQFSKYINKDGNFIIPEEYLTSKTKLQEFVRNINKQLESVWKRAENNLNKPKKATQARNTLTIQNHLNQRLDDINALQDGLKAVKNIDYTIKMWDRVPQKDLFQGNYTNCCIAVGASNGDAMPYYLLDTCYNMIEIEDNNTGKIIGNALCFMVKDEAGKPIFIIDNIELANSAISSDEISAELRDAIKEYAANVAREITGNDNTPIYLGTSYNDINLAGLKKNNNKKVDFLGEITLGDNSRDDIYMDLYGGWTTKDELTDDNKVTVYVLKGTEPLERKFESQTTELKVRQTADILDDIRNAQTREDFIKLRDEIKVMPKSKEKSELVQAYRDKFNDWSKDPHRHEIKNQYEGETEDIPNNETDFYGIKDIQGSVDENTVVKQEIKDEIKNILVPVFSSTEHIMKFINNIPNEYCAEVILKYIQKYSSDTNYEDEVGVVAKYLHDKDDITEFVQYLEISKQELTPDKILLGQKFDGFGNLYYLQEEKGYDITARDYIDYQEIGYLIKEDNPMLTRMYFSKLFSGTRFYQINQESWDMNEEKLAKLNRLDKIMDPIGTCENFGISSAEQLLLISDEQIDIVEKRGLLKRIDGRSDRLTGDDILEIIALSDEEWANVEARRLLLDIPGRKTSYGVEKALSGTEIGIYAKCDEKTWNKILERNLLNLVNIADKDNIKKELQDTEFLVKLAKLSEEDFAKIQSYLTDLNDNKLEILSIAMKFVRGKFIFDEATYNYAEDLSKTLGWNSEYVVKELVLKVSNDNGTINEKVANDFKEFAKKAIKSGYQASDIRTMLNPDEVIYASVIDDNLGGTKPPTIKAEDIAAKTSMIELLKEELEKNQVIIMNTWDRAPIIGKTTADSLAAIEKIIQDLGLSNATKIIKGLNSDCLAYLKGTDIKSALKRVGELSTKMQENPDLYVNGEFENPDELQLEVVGWVTKHVPQLTFLSTIFDTKTMLHLMRMRFDDAEEYLKAMNYFSLDDIKILADLQNSTNASGHAFLEKQKVEFIDLIAAYKANNLSTDKIRSMIDNGRVDIGELTSDLFHAIMKNSGMTDEEIAQIPPEKLLGWDTKYAHLLSKEIQEERDAAFSDILRAGNLEPDFKAYLNNPENVYGQTNAVTKTEFEELKLDYDKWLNPSKQNEIRFKTKDENAEYLHQIAEQIEADMNTLIKPDENDTPEITKRKDMLRGVIKKVFPKFIDKEGGFSIPDEYLSNKTKLEELVKKLADTSEQGQLSGMWNRALKNAEQNERPDLKAKAQVTVTILDHLKTRIDDISKAKDGKTTKTLDLTVKMWDRVPQKDIFQGNYSTCCIGMGHGNGSAMPYYVMDTAFNMIEIIDNTTGKTIGNALCYFVKGEDGKPVFILDNIEIANASKPSEEGQKQVRDAITEYAANVAREVTGNDNTPIYMSDNFNDVPTKDLPKDKKAVSFVGKINREDIYMDLYNGWVDTDKLTENCYLIQLKGTEPLERKYETPEKEISPMERKEFVSEPEGELTNSREGELSGGQIAKPLTKEEFTDALLDFVVKTNKNSTPPTEDEIADWKKEGAVIFTKSYEKYSDFWAELMKKDSNGEYIIGNSSKYEEIFSLANKVCEDEFENPQDAVKELRRIKLIYDYIDEIANNKEVNPENFGLSEKHAAVISQMIKDTYRELDDYDINHIAERIINLKNTDDVDFMLEMSKKCNFSYDRASDITAKLKTDAIRNNFNLLWDKTKNDNGNSELEEDALIVISRIMDENPAIRQRIDKILEIKDQAERIKQLNVYNSKYFLLDGGYKEFAQGIQQYKLFECEKLSPKDILSLSYNDSEVLDKIVERGLLTDDNIEGSDVGTFAVMSDKKFDIYKKLLENDRFSPKDAQDIVKNCWEIETDFEKYDLINIPQIKTAADVKDFCESHYYGAWTDNILTRPELKEATHLDYSDLKYILQYVDNDRWARVTRRGLLQNPELSKKGFQVDLLSSLDEATYQKALKNGSAYKLGMSIDERHNAKLIIDLEDEIRERYFEIRENPPTDNRVLSVQDIYNLALMDKPKYEEAVKFLYLENRKTNEQFEIRDINSLLGIFGRVGYDNEQYHNELLELANLKVLKDQKVSALTPEELRKLMTLYHQKVVTPKDGFVFDEILELITNQDRNNATGKRLNVDQAEKIVQTIHNNGISENKDENKAAIAQKLMCLPLRGSDQLDVNSIIELTNFLESPESIEQYKELFYSLKRATIGASQLNGNDIFELLHLINVYGYDNVKKFIFVEKRGKVNQFDAKDIEALLELTPEQLAQTEKYYNIENRNDARQFPGIRLAEIGSFNPEQLEGLDKLLAMESEKDTDPQILLDLSRSCGSEKKDVFENYIKLRKNAGNKIYCENAYNYAKYFSNEQFDIFMELLKKTQYTDIDSLIDISALANIDKTKYKRALSYIDNGTNAEDALLYAHCEDLKIKDKYEDALEHAKQKRNQLKSGREDLTDRDIENFFNRKKSDLVAVIDLLGLAPFEYAYTSKLTGLESLAECVYELKSHVPDTNYAWLRAKLADRSLEPQEKLAKLRAIAGLRQHTSDEELRSYIDLIKPNTPTRDEIKQAKDIWANPKARFEDKFNEFCETFGIDKNNQKVKDFFEKRATVNAKGYKILNNVKESDISKLLETEVVKKRNQKEWNEAIDKKIFSTIGIAYSPELSAKLKLTDNKYLPEILSSNGQFRDNFGEMIDEIIAKPDKTIREVFDEMPQNIETRHQFEALEIDYDKWVTTDKNSFRAVKISTNAEKTKQDAVANLEKDFNDAAFKALPQEETKKILDALEKTDIIAVTKSEPIYDIDGFIIRYEDTTHFYKGQALEPINFKDAEKMISVIKKTMNENDFWTTRSSDAILEENKNTVYNHIMKLRDAEIDNASKLKDDKETEIEVRKTDMNNISHSLFLGNHGSCCTAVGTGCNQFAAPRYCMDKCISAIEVVDGKDFVGNSMCYFALVDGELSLVLDNIELSGKYQYNDNIRDTFMEYAKQLCAEVGLPDAPIYAGPYRHKLNMTPYPTAEHKITIIGSTNGDATYIDFVTGRYVIDGQREDNVTMFKIR